MERDKTGLDDTNIFLGVVAWYSKEKRTENNLKISVHRSNIALVAVKRGLLQRLPQTEAIGLKTLA